MQDVLGVRPEGRRPAFRRKHDTLVGVLSDQIKEDTAHQQRQHCCVQQNLHSYVDVLAVQVVDNIVDLLALQGNGAAAPFP
jgi:hypothetical protein